jgi:hypothetical protein
MHDEVRTLVGCRFTGRYTFATTDDPDTEVLSPNEQAIVGAVVLL